jgi:hypothetical protein
MTNEPQHISVIDPINPAIERVKQMLFKPFDLARWFNIGFCAWLAYLLSGGFAGSQGRHDGGIHPGGLLGQAKEFVLNNLLWVLPSIIVGAALVIVLVLVIVWLRSRGEFMFLHCVAMNKDEVKSPWHKFREHANSLFLFRVVLGIIGTVVTGMFILPIILLIVLVAAKSGDGLNLTLVASIVLLAMLFFVVIICLMLVRKFTIDFVVPIMFLRTTSCVEGWREFLQLFSGRKGAFALYVLFQIVIAMAISVIVIAAICITCCCACCVMMIPYLGTVLLLPILVFERSYSVYYLRQFGPQFDVFAGETIQPVPPPQVV